MPPIPLEAHAGWLPSDDDLPEDDEAAVKQLRAEFIDDFNQVRDELEEVYGTPSRTGWKDDHAIPLNGVFRFAIWEVREQLLFVATAQESRAYPISPVLGTTSS